MIWGFLIFRAKGQKDTKDITQTFFKHLVHSLLNPSACVTHYLQGSMALAGSDLMVEIWRDYIIFSPLEQWTHALVSLIHGSCSSSPEPWLDVREDKPDRRGYLPVRKAALLGVHTDAAATCWVSITPSSARRSIFGVLQRET